MTSEIPRNSLALTMLCAWNNIPADQMPPEWANHPNDQNRQAWERVAEAARKFIAEEKRAAISPSPLNTRAIEEG